MVDASVGTYTCDFHSDQNKYISKEQRYTNCSELDRNLKSALAELTSAQLIIKLLQKESHQERTPKDTTDNTCVYLLPQRPTA
jgi:predicted metal-dependent hydrolase